jgi:hypothetical protein
MSTERLRRLQEGTTLLRLQTAWAQGRWTSRTASAWVRHVEREMGGSDDQDTRALREYACRLEIRHGVKVKRNDTEGSFLNAYAWPSTRTVERPEIKTIEDALAAAHEAMHIAHPCDSTVNAHLKPRKSGQPSSSLSSFWFF